MMEHTLLRILIFFLGAAVTLICALFAPMPIVILGIAFGLLACAVAVIGGRFDKDSGQLEEDSLRLLKQTAFDLAPGAITITDTENNIVAVNKAFTEITGYDASEVLGKNPRVLSSGQHGGDFYRDMWAALLSEGQWQGEIWNRNKAGRIYPERISIATVTDEGGQIRNHIANFQDLSDQKEAEIKLQKQSQILGLLHVIAECVNSAESVEEALATAITYMCAFLEWPIGHALLLREEEGARFHFISTDIWHIENMQEYSAFVDVTMAEDFSAGDGLPGQVLTSARSAWSDSLMQTETSERAAVSEVSGIQSGLAVPILVGPDVVATLEFFTGDRNRPDEDLMQVLDDIGHQLGRVFERDHAQRELKHLAHYDALTGLPLKRLTEDRIDNALALARRHAKRAALLFLDLDGFKAVNDTYGHEAGDQLLKEIARRLKAELRETDTVARIGGDEFLAVITELDQRANAGAVAEKLIAAVCRPVALAGTEVEVGVSIGIGVYPEDAKDGDTLIMVADQAMYEVKRSGKNNYRFAATPETGEENQLPISA